MENLKLCPTSRLRGKIVLPASKSISARALIINALSGSDLLPQNLSDSDDTKAMLRGLQSSSESPLRGARSKEQGAREHQLPEQTSCSLPPCPLPLKKEGRRGSVIDIGAAGTAMRFLTAFLSVTPGEYVITGTERMRQRPISILVDALRQLGADIAYEGEEGFPPLRIVGKAGLEGGQLTVAGNVSSQYISALMMIAPTLRKGLRLTLTGRIASRPYLDMTVAMMRDFGAKVEWEASPLRGGLEGSVIEVQPGTYTQRPYHIESDWSAASYWYEMVAVAPDTEAEVELTGLHRDSIQGDSKVREMFRHLGVETTFFRDHLHLAWHHIPLQRTCQPENQGDGPHGSSADRAAQAGLRRTRGWGERGMVGRRTLSGRGGTGLRHLRGPSHGYVARSRLPSLRKRNTDKQP